MTTVPAGASSVTSSRMRRGRVLHLVLRQRAAQVRARHHTRWSIFRGEVVQQPDRVAHPKLASGHWLTPVGVERLMALSGQRRPVIERGQLEIRSEHLSDASQHARMRKADVEHGALVHQVRQALGTGFLAELRARLVALGLQQLVHPGAQAAQLSGVRIPLSGRNPSWSSWSCSCWVSVSGRTPRLSSTSCMVLQHSAPRRVRAASTDPPIHRVGLWWPATNAGCG